MGPGMGLELRIWNLINGLISIEKCVFDKHIEFLNVLFDLHNYHYKLKIRYYLAGESVSVQSSPHLVIVT